MKCISLLLLTLLLLSSTIVSKNRNKIWSNELTLWVDIKNKNQPKPSVLTNLAQALDSSGHIRDATNYYIKALRLDNNYTRAHNNLGVLYLENINIELGFKHLREAITISPNYTEARYNLATAHQMLEEHNEAVFHYKKLLQTNPKHFKALNNIALSYHALKDFDLAISFFKDALLVNGTSLKVAMNLATTYLAKGEFKKARLILEQIIAVQPLNKEAHMLLNIVSPAPSFYKEDFNYNQ